MLYADDQTLMDTSESQLQIMAHHLNLMARKYKMKASKVKTISVAMYGYHTPRANNF
jgi:hypothetical protein